MADASPSQPGRVRSLRPWWPGLASVLVLASAAIGLRLADAVPGWLYGLPRGVHRCPSLTEATARTGLDLRDVKDMQATLGWRPTEIRTTVHPPAVAVSLRRNHEPDQRRDQTGDHRGGEQNETELILYRSRGQQIPDALCSPLSAFHSIAVPLARGRSATLAATARSGDVLHELSWSEGDERTVMRFAGRTVELLRLARVLVDRGR
jgi:hypothetical protein